MSLWKLDMECAKDRNAIVLDEILEDIPKQARLREISDGTASLIGEREAVFIVIKDGIARVAHAPDGQPVVLVDFDGDFEEPEVVVVKSEQMRIG